MTKVTIDGQEYDSDLLSDEAKAHFVSIRYVDQELSKLAMQSAALQTAKNAYGKALKEAIAGLKTGESVTEVEVEQIPDNLSFD